MNAPLPFGEHAVWLQKTDAIFYALKEIGDLEFLSDENNKRLAELEHEIRELQRTQREPLEAHVVGLTEAIASKTTRDAEASLDETIKRMQRYANQMLALIDENKRIQLKQRALAEHIAVRRKALRRSTAHSRDRVSSTTN